MKKSLLFFMAIISIAKAQVVPPQYNVSPAYSLTDTIKNYNIREKLVQLAMNNPSYEISDRLSTIAAYQLRLAKGSWLAAISAQGNINEFTINPKSAGTSTNGVANPIYYPRYNFGIAIPLDIITRNSNNVKIARENYMISQANKNDRFRQLKAEVLTDYEDYLLAKQKLELQIEITQDAYTSYQLSENDYRKNLIKAEEYAKSYRNWVSEQEVKLEMQRNLNVTKINLEKLIGVRLDDVLKLN